MWPEHVVAAYKQLAHDQQYTHAQAEGMLRWSAFVAPQIARDGTAALSDQFWRAFANQARALGTNVEAGQGACGRD